MTSEDGFPDLKTLPMRTRRAIARRWMMTAMATTLANDFDVEGERVLWQEIIALASPNPGAGWVTGWVSREEHAAALRIAREETDSFSALVDVAARERDAARACLAEMRAADAARLADIDAALASPTPTQGAPSMHADYCAASGNFAPCGPCDCGADISATSVMLKGGAP